MALLRALGVLGHGIGAAAASSGAAGAPVLPAAARGLLVSARACWPDILVPTMGESIKEGTVAAVLKQTGQTVKEDEVCGPAGGPPGELGGRGRCGRLRLRASDGTAPKPRQEGGRGGAGGGLVAEGQGFLITAASSCSQAATQPSAGRSPDRKSVG